MSFYRSGRVFGYTYTIEGKTDKGVTLTVHDKDKETVYEHITRTEAFNKIQKIYSFEVGIT